MAKLPPLCRWCGKLIKKRTRLVWIFLKGTEKNHPMSDSSFSRSLFVTKERWPRTKADCQRFTNWTVVSVSRKYGTDDGLIGQFGEWDGESYDDDFFCTGEHARLFGYAAVNHGLTTKSYRDAIAARESPDSQPRENHDA